VVEAKAGSGAGAAQPGLSTFNSVDGNPSARPDLQIEASQNIGNGSIAVCDAPALPGMTPSPGAQPGGVPATNPPNFDPASQQVANVLNDFGCRFDTHDLNSPCTLNINGNPSFVCVGAHPNSQCLATGTTLQYCTVGVIGSDLEFHSGDTVLTVQVRDQAGHIGFPHQIVVRAP
jgi:hypothetical protein